MTGRRGAAVQGRDLLRERLAERLQLGVSRGDGNADLLRDPGGCHAAQGVGEDAVPAQRDLGFGHAVAQALAGAGSHNNDRRDGTGR